jgi:hypothetical protein
MLFEVRELNVFILDEVARLLCLLLIAMLPHAFHVIFFLFMLSVDHHNRIAEFLDFGANLALMICILLQEGRLRGDFEFLRRSPFGVSQTQCLLLRLQFLQFNLLLLVPKDFDLRLEQLLLLIEGK